MFYCLKENYLLRGWDKLPTGIVKRMSGEVYFLDPNLYSRIRDFDWMVFEGSPFLTKEQQQFMTQLAEHGLVDLCEKPRPLSKEQAYRKYPNRYLRAVHWAITGRCNCRCRHCYMSAPSGNAGDYSHEECMNIIDQMEAAGIQVVSLTGGEALTRKDFLEIAERLTDAGIRIDVIMSNGLLVNEPLLDSLTGMGQKPECFRSMPERPKCSAAVRFVFDQGDLEAMERLKAAHPEYLIRAEIQEISDTPVTDSGSRFGAFLMAAPETADLMPYLPEGE